MKIRLSSGWRRAVPAVGLVALAAYLVPSVFLGLAASVSKVHVAQSERRDDAWQALARNRGRHYADAIAHIRAVLPEDSEYLLLENDAAPGAHMLVRFDLAPRRAIFGGRTQDVRSNVTFEKLPTLPRWTVVPALDPPGPRVVETRLVAEKGSLP